MVQETDTSHGLLLQAASRGDVARMEHLIAGWSGVDAAGQGGQTALHLAAASDCAAAVRLLIASGGRTPLHKAALHGHAKVVRLLLNHGADPLARDASGNSPRDAAFAVGDDEIVELLRGTERK